MQPRAMAASALLRDYYLDSQARPTIWQGAGVRTARTCAVAGQKPNVCATTAERIRAAQAETYLQGREIDVRRLGRTRACARPTLA